MRNKELKYIDYDEALVVYAKTVAASGGGLSGVKDEGESEKCSTLFRTTCIILPSLTNSHILCSVCAPVITSRTQTSAWH